VMETMGPITCSIRGRAFDLSLFDGQRNQGKLFDLVDIRGSHLSITSCSRPAAAPVRRNFKKR